MTIWVSDGRTVLVTRYDDGMMTVATRPGPDAIWSPPIIVRPERGQ
jgi:hypothetical protein